MPRKTTQAKKQQARTATARTSSGHNSLSQSCHGRLPGPEQGQGRRKAFLDQLWMLADSLDRSVERILKD